MRDRQIETDRKCESNRNETERYREIYIKSVTETISDKIQRQRQIERQKER